MSLEERVDRLERENRRLRLVGLLALCFIGVIFVMGQTRVPQRIEAESFVVRNPYGQTAAVLGTNQTPGPQHGWGELTLYDTQDHSTFALWPLNDGPRMMVFGQANPDGGIPVIWQAP